MTWSASTANLRNELRCGALTKFDYWNGYSRYPLQRHSDSRRTDFDGCAEYRDVCQSDEITGIGCLAARQTQSKTLLDRFKAWLDCQSIPPQSLLGKAIAYTIREWPRLIVYLDDGRLNIDSNLVENAIRPLAIGRKSWRFSAMQAGATSSANLYSLLSSARANTLNEYAYLKYLFTNLPASKTDADLDALLPWNLTNHQLAPMLRMPDVSTT